MEYFKAALFIFQAILVLGFAHVFFGYFTAWHSGWAKLADSFRTDRSVHDGQWTWLWPRVGKTFLSIKVKIDHDGLILRGRLLPPFMFIGTGIDDLFIPWEEIHDISHHSIFGMKRISFKVGLDEKVQFELISSLFNNSPLQRP